MVLKNPTLHRYVSLVHNFKLESVFDKIHQYMILVPLHFIFYIFCMNNEIQTRKGKIKTNTMKVKKHTVFFIIIILIVEVRFPKNFNFEIWVSLEWELYYLKK